LPHRILNAKLKIPPLRLDYVPRPHLVARLQEGLDRKLTLLATPPGFGKTTLLCEWLDENQLPAAWVSLDEADNDHGRFISYVMAALHQLNTGIEEQIQAISQAAAQGVALESYMTVLLNDFATLPDGMGPVILVLDDYHIIHNPAIHNSMIFALDYIPRNLHIVISSRSEPPLRLSRLRARRQVNELHAQDLRFSLPEVGALFKQTGGMKLSSAQLTALEERTEGWIAGLQLAMLAMSGRSDVDLFVRDFTGTHRYILDYLADEVLSRQSSDVTDFLLKTSILKRMTAGLCDEVTGQKNGREMLSLLEQENLFVVPLDGQGQWYRYHHLFADLLKTRAEKFSAKDLSALHRKAGLWFDAHSQPYEAIEHALAARDYDLALGMMVKATPLLAMHSEVGTVMKWLNVLPNEMRLTNPRVSLMYAWAHFFMSDIESVEPHLLDVLIILGLDSDALDAWPLKTSISYQDIEILAQIYALRTFVVVNQGHPDLGIRIAVDALSHIPKADKLSHFALLAALGDAYRDADNFAAASQAYSEALSISEALDLYAASLTMRMDLARLRVNMGQMRYAEVICREVLDWGFEYYHPLFPVAQAYTLMGDILRERNEIDAAEKILAAGIQQCEWAGYQRYLVFCHVSLARLMLARRDNTALERSLNSAEHTAALSGSETLQTWVRHFRARLLPADSSNWLATSSLSLDDQGCFQREDEYLTLVRLYLKQMIRSRLTESRLILNLLERLLLAAQKSARIGSVIEILLLQALTLQVLGRNSEALAKFRESLSLAEPERYARLFVDEGAAVAELLILAIQHNIHSNYANHLLALIKENQPATSNSYETLTERESEVLRLLAAGLSNLEIGEKLNISLSTIKTHITRIYSKLGVTSRTQVIVRARELKIL
jgi:LuxR family transcriptional regulator, maltose regulon positive regulatory protein